MTIGLILLAIALTEFFLGLYFIFRYEKPQSTIWYGLFFIGASVYVGANGFGYVGSIISSSIAERLAWTGGILATTFFLPFSQSFPIPRKTLREWIPWVMWPLLIFVPGLLFTDLLVQTGGIIRFGPGYMTNTGPYFWVIPVFIISYWIWSCTGLGREFPKSDGIHRLVLKLVIIGVLSSLAASIVFDITLPLITATRFGYVGSLFTSVWLLLTAYILVKK